MILCFCRAVNGQPQKGVSDKAVESHIQVNPHLLGKTWDIVSQDMTGEKMRCGRCEDAGNQCLGQLKDEAELAGLTNKPSPVMKCVIA